MSKTALKEERRRRNSVYIFAHNGVLGIDSSNLTIHKPQLGVITTPYCNADRHSGWLVDATLIDISSEALVALAGFERSWHDDIANIVAYSEEGQNKLIFGWFGVERRAAFHPSYACMSHYCRASVLLPFVRIVKNVVPATFKKHVSRELTEMQAFRAAMYKGLSQCASVPNASVTKKGSKKK
jgi:hypothetical protein